MNTKFWSENLNGDLDVEGRIILERVLQKQGGKVWTGCIGLKTVTSCVLL